jgi:gliding motility-associated-like protein
MNTHKFLLSFLALGLCTLLNAQSTFQKYINLPGNISYPGLYSDGIGYDAATQSVFVQADQHDGCCNAPPGLLKLDTMGNIIWSRFTNVLGTTVGSPGSYYNGGYALVSRNTAIAGGYSSGIINYDGAGNLVSSTDVNTNVSGIVDLHIAGAARMPNGDMLVTGYGPVNNHFKDMYYARLGPTGTVIWSGYSGDNDGYWENGWGADYDPVTLDCYFVGQNISFSQTNSTDIHIVKTDINGNVLYTRNIATPSTDVAYCVKVLPNQDVVLVGTTDIGGNTQITFIRMTPTGTIITACRYAGGGSNNTIRNLNTLPNGNLLLTGYVNAFGSGGLDGFNMEVDLNGNIIWQKAYGSIDDDSFINSVIFNNSIFTAGTRNFGNGTGTGYQVYLVKTKLDGTFDNPSCLTVNGNFTRVVQTYTIIAALNITPSGFNLPATFTESAYVPAQTLICGTSISLSATSTNCTCFGICNGTATASPSGGTGPYTYAWLPSGGNAAAASGLCAGTYTCTITDATMATATVTVTITQPPQITASISATPIECSIGWAYISTTVLSGNGPFTYSWSPSGGTGNIAQVFVAGNYTCTITDANGCTSTISTAVVPGPPPTCSISSTTNIPCNGGTNGTATVQASSGTAPYSYAWSPSGGTGATANNLGAGTYTVTVTDSTGCEATATVNITEPPAITTTITANSATCGNNNGSATVAVNGGTGPYTYAWSPSGGTGATESNLAVGVYNVTITDANGCTATDIATISSSNGPTATIASQQDLSCFGGTNGSATVNPTGNGPFTYSWSPSGGNAASASNLTSGTYTCTITDQSGCTVVQLVTITSPTAISVPASSTAASCGNTNGTATVNPSGGTGPYTFLWNNSQTGSTATALAGGTYNVIVTDANGCTNTATVVVANNGAPAITLQSSTDVTCFGGTNGTATINATGGQGPYTYSWSPVGGTNATATGLPSGNYTVTVTGSDGCSQTQTVTITQPTAILISDSVSAENCGDGDGIANAYVSGGNPIYTFLWSNGATTAGISNLSAGNYSVIVTDANGCSASTTLIVPGTGSASANATGTTTIYMGANTQLFGTGTGIYSWSPSGTLSCANCPTPVASPTVTTTYTLTVTDSLGCTASDTVTVYVDINCGQLYIPNAFSPNGDNENDILYVRSNCIQVIEFQVYNRWGERVFMTTDPSIGWDGTWRGEACESAVFNYFLRVTFIDGSTAEKEGNVSLVK